MKTLPVISELPAPPPTEPLSFPNRHVTPKMPYESEFIEKSLVSRQIADMINQRSIGTVSSDEVIRAALFNADKSLTGNFRTLKTSLFFVKGDLLYENTTAISAGR